MKKPDYNAPKEEVLEYQDLLLRKRIECSNDLVKTLKDVFKRVSEIKDDELWEKRSNPNAFWACEDFIGAVKLVNIISDFDSKLSELHTEMCEDWKLGDFDKKGQYANVSKEDIIDLS